VRRLSGTSGIVVQIIHHRRRSCVADRTFGIGAWRRTFGGPASVAMAPQATGPLARRLKSLSPSAFAAVQEEQTARRDPALLEPVRQRVSNCENAS
jgi:hypothetical protein